MNDHLFPAVHPLERRILPVHWQQRRIIGVRRSHNRDRKPLLTIAAIRRSSQAIFAQNRPNRDYGAVSIANGEIDGRRLIG